MGQHFIGREPPYGNEDSWQPFIIEDKNKKPPFKSSTEQGKTRVAVPQPQTCNQYPATTTKVRTARTRPRDKKTNMGANQPCNTNMNMQAKASPTMQPPTVQTLALHEKHAQHANAKHANAQHKMHSIPNNKFYLFSLKCKQG